MFTASHCEDVGILTGIVPILDSVQSLTGHGVDQLTQQGANVAEQTRGNPGVFNPAILHGVVQGVDVLVVTPCVEVGVLVVQQLMHHITRILDHKGTAHRGIVRDASKVQVAIRVDASGLDIMPPVDGHLTQTQGLAHLVGEGLQTQAELKTSDRGAGQNGFDVHTDLTEVG